MARDCRIGCRVHRMPRGSVQNPKSHACERAVDRAGCLRGARGCHSRRQWSRPCTRRASRTPRRTGKRAARAARRAADVLSTGEKNGAVVNGTDSTGAHARAQQPCVTAGLVARSASMAKSNAQVGRGMAR
eukprot:3786363-Pyramimonas_sp.AAC.1